MFFYIFFPGLLFCIPLRPFYPFHPFISNAEGSYSENTEECRTSCIEELSISFPPWQRYDQGESVWSWHHCGYRSQKHNMQGNRSLPTVHKANTPDRGVSLLVGAPVNPPANRDHMPCWRVGRGRSIALRFRQ